MGIKYLNLSSVGDNTRRKVCCKVSLYNKSSAVAEMCDRGHNRHGPKRGGAVPLSRSAGNPSNTMWPAPMSTSVPVASSSIQPFGHNSIGCHSPHIGKSVPILLSCQNEMHTVTVRSDVARYLLN